jgi:PPOX class probable F420-dependent enzyme
MATNREATDAGPLEIPDDSLRLLERPLYVHLATIGPRGQPQVNPMWFDWDGSRLRFTHTDQRQKYRNVRRDPRVAISILDPDQPYHYLELRGVVESIERDPEAVFFNHLAERYGVGLRNPADRAHRVVLVVRPESLTRQ